MSAHSRLAALSASDLRPFTPLFAAVVDAIPPGEWAVIARHMRAVGTRVRVLNESQSPTSEGEWGPVVGCVIAGGQQVAFRRAFLAAAPPDAVTHLIAHEFGHVFQHAAGHTRDDDGEWEDAADRIARHWGFPATPFDDWLAARPQPFDEWAAARTDDQIDADLLVESLFA